MKTQEDVLSFEDLQTYDNFLIDLAAEIGEIAQDDVGRRIVKLINEDRPQLIDRFIHTFLEWDLYDKYIYHLSWRISYTTQGDHPPIIAGTRVDTLQEAEIIAIKKISRFLHGVRIHLESMKESPDISHPSPYDSLYKVIDGDNQYRGMVAIERMEQLK